MVWFVIAKCIKNRPILSINATLVNRGGFGADTDTSLDDAVVLVMALGAPDVQVKAIIILAGIVKFEVGKLPG
jgi:hypothetical protein